MRQVTQVLPNDLVVRALNYYKHHIAHMKKELGEEKFYENVVLANDEFDVCSEKVLYEKASKIEVTFDKALYEYWNQMSGCDVDYPVFDDTVYPLYEVVEKTQVVKSKRKIQVD